MTRSMNDTTPIQQTNKQQCQRGFWGGLAVIVVIAGGLRLLSFAYSLPYVDHIDEPEIYLEALAWRGGFDPIPVMTAYPPGSLALSWAVQSALEPLGYTGLSVNVFVNRLLSVFSNVLTLVFIALSAQRIGGSLAGLVAGAAWGLSPLVLENGVYALPDPHVYLLLALATWLALEALLDANRRHWCVWSVLAGAVAVLFKYPALPALLPGGLVALWLLHARRRRALGYLAAQALIAGLLVFFLVFIYQIDRMDMNVTRQAEGRFVTNLLTPARLIENLHTTLMPISMGAFVLYGVAALLAYGYAQRRGLPRVDAPAVLLLALALVLFAWAVSAFSTMSTTGRIRDIMPGTTLACMLLGAAAEQIAAVLPLRSALVRSMLATLPLLALVFAPQLRADWTLVQQRMLPDRRVEIHAWVNDSLEPGTIIVNRDNHKTFNPFFGGLQGRHWYDWWETGDITEYSLSEWITRGMTYAALDRAQWESLIATETGQAYLADTLPLRAFFSPPRLNGPETMVLRLWRMQRETSAVFDGYIRLLGYDLSSPALHPGETLTLRFYWQAERQPPLDYSLFVHLVVQSSDTPLAQADGAPARPQRLTPTWADPDETLISQAFTLILPPDLPPGDYALRIGLYDHQTGARLPVVTAGGMESDALLLTPVSISRADENTSSAHITPS
jgi:hypothetical protein